MMNPEPLPIVDGGIPEKKSNLKYEVKNKYHSKETTSIL